MPAKLLHPKLMEYKLQWHSRVATLAEVVVVTMVLGPLSCLVDSLTIMASGPNSRVVILLVASLLQEDTRIGA